MARRKKSIPISIVGVNNIIKSESLAQSKNDAKKVAKALFYPDSVIEAISDAKTESEITRILQNARHSDIKKKGKT